MRTIVENCMSKTLKDGRSTWLLVSDTAEWAEMAQRFMEEQTLPLVLWRVQAELVKLVSAEDFFVTLKQVLDVPFPPEQLVVVCASGMMTTYDRKAVEEVIESLNNGFNFSRYLQSFQTTESKLQALFPRIATPESSIVEKWLSTIEAYNEGVKEFDWATMWGAREGDESASKALNDWALRFRRVCGGTKQMREIYGGPKLEMVHCASGS